MMPLAPKSLAGPGYVILNIIRGINILSLLAIMVADVVLLIKLKTQTNVRAEPDSSTSKTNASQFFFFQSLSHVASIGFAALLLISECNLFRNYFSTTWPLLSPNHGFVPLGLAIFLLGCYVLGNLNEPELSFDRMGHAYWRIVVGAGIVAMIMGIFNVIASYIFRSTALDVTAREVRAKGAVAVSAAKSSKDPLTISRPIGPVTKYTPGSIATSSSSASNSTAARANTAASDRTKLTNAMTATTIERARTPSPRPSRPAQVVLAPAPKHGSAMISPLRFSFFAKRRSKHALPDIEKAQPPCLRSATLQ
ncbi:hypothetical protein MRB53_038600 [Persea americana]|nr:hypothetical protein MRB53_038600 [Persea americana]